MGAYIAGKGCCKENFEPHGGAGFWSNYAAPGILLASCIHTQLTLRLQLEVIFSEHAVPAHDVNINIIGSRDQAETGQVMA